jgi:hypothetical protein
MTTNPMIKIKLFSILFTCVSLQSFSQTTFQKLIGTGYNSEAYAVRPTTDGGYVLTGYADIVSPTNSSIYLIKTNSNGEVTWTRTFSIGDYNAGYGVQQTYDGGYIIAGSATKTATDIDIYVIKTNALGDTLWTRTYGGDSSDVAYNIQQTVDSGYIIAATSNSFGAGQFDAYLVKLDKNGAIDWSHTFGGSDFDEGTDVKQTADSGFILFGTTYNFGASNKDFYVIKTDAHGDTAWSKIYGGSAFEVASSVTTTFDGGYVFAGYTSSFGVTSGGIYIMKTDGNGDTLWTRTYDLDYFEIAKQVQQTADSGFIIAGYTNSADRGIRNAFLIKTDGNGNPTWRKTYGGYAYEGCASGQQAADGGYVIAGSSSSFGSYQGAVYLVKTDKDGNTGCNQDITNFTPGRTTTVTKRASTIVGSGGVATPTVTDVGSGEQDSVLCLVTGIEAFNEIDLMTIYPNPARNYINIDIRENDFQSCAVYIINAMGQNVCQPSVSRGGALIDISMLPQGIYMLRILNDKRSWVGKFLKE